MAFLGADGFHWGIGVVEDRFDPEQLGRVRVRWLGIHDESKEKILTKDLPWSTVMQPATATAMSGVGVSTAVVEGSWVCGFAKDPGTLQDWIVMGLLPGDNTTTAFRGAATSGRAWGQYRGDYKKWQEKYSTEIPGSATEYKDYEKGFFDPTVDQRNIPHRPSDASYGNPGLSPFTPTTPPMLVDNLDPKFGIPRVPNWATGIEVGGSGDHPDIQDLDPENVMLWPKPFQPGVAPPIVRATHSDMLHSLFKTTRRITMDERFAPDWTHFGTFRWADSYTYSKDGQDEAPSYVGAVVVETAEDVGGEDKGVEERKAYAWGEEKGSKGVIFSTGYLEPAFWSEDRDYGKKGGTWGPDFPVTRDMPANSQDPADMTGIDPKDTRAAWGGTSNETGAWGTDGEDFRVPYPRVRWVAKGHLSPTERQTVMTLFNIGHYGTGIYNINDMEAGRQDIKWADVGESDLVVVPTPDTNALAMGGIPISTTDGMSVTTAASLWGDSTSYFADPDLSRGHPAKPLLQKGDIVQIAGVRGMQEINGRIFRLMSCSAGADSFSMQLATVDGNVWSGPGGISWISGDEGLGSPIVGGSVVDASMFSAYLGGGVVIPHNPHWSLCWKADMRERQINIGSPDPDTGVEGVPAEHLGFWNQPSGDYNARYPFNNVYESESGHVMEYDDTPGAERISQFHRSGTNYEIDHNGTKTEYVKGDNYDIRLHDDYMYVKGKVVHTYDDEVMIRYNDRADISSKWKLQLWSGGDLDIHSKRNINMKSDGDINLQADGHINLHGTGVTPEQTDTTRAGSRNAFERSKIKMKAGHFELDMVGNEDKPHEYGIFMQSDQNPIGIKTLLKGKPQGDIHISAAEDMELFAWNNQYREAHTFDINDYAQRAYYLTTADANINRTANLGKIIDSAYLDFDIKSCTEDLNLTAAWKDINIKASGLSDPDVLGGRINIQTVSNTVTGSGVFSLLADDAIQIKSTNKHINIEAVKDSDGTINIKAAEDMRLQAADVMNIKGGSKIKETADNIYMNTSAESATAADAANPIVADTASGADGAIRTFIPETMILLSIDLPNPRSAQGTSLTDLALNINTNPGYGGENIRNLHDTMVDMQLGLSAYVTKTYPATKGTKVYDEDQDAYVWVGDKTQVLEEPWNGYEQKPKEQEPLGPVGPKRYNPSTRATPPAPETDPPIACE